MSALLFALTIALALSVSIVARAAPQPSDLVFANRQTGHTNIYRLAGKDLNNLTNSPASSDASGRLGCVLRLADCAVGPRSLMVIDG